MNAMEKFRLVFSLAADDPVRYEIQLAGQSKALSDYQIDLSAKAAKSAPDLAAIGLVQLLQCATGKTVGGLCVRIRRSGQRLPTEESLSDPWLTRMIEAQQHRNPCELHSLWISSEYRKQGLVPFIVYGGMAAATLMGSETKFGSAHEKSAKIYEAIGLTVHYGRVYHWPDERFRTHVVTADVQQYLRSEQPYSVQTRDILDAFRRELKYEFAGKREPKRASRKVAAG